ncbi:MAG: metal ABC transporter permease [Muribaculaceae bacterium]|nr:metal ABC transporter permease [Muribaculaceae bacterium]
MEILGYTFFQNALIGVLLVSVASAIIGTYVVTRRMVFISGGITHACFGGLGLGYFLGMNPLFMAMVFAVGSSLGVEWLSTKQRVREDSAIAVMWAFGMAIGTLFIFLSPGYVPELTSFLFGNILTITATDLTLFAIYTAVLIAFFTLMYRVIVICAFDTDFATTMQLPVKAINYTMTIFIAVCIVLTIRLIGIMLLMSLFTLPQMIAEIYSKQYKQMTLLAIAISVISSLSGLFIAYFIDVPASATIVIVLITLYCVARVSKTLLQRRKLQ